MRAAPPALLRLLLLGALALGVLAPLLVLLVASVGRAWFWPALLPPELTGESWRAALAPRARLGAAAATSVGLAFGTGLVSMVLALPIGRALARLRGPWRHVAAGLAFLPVAAPPIALGIGLQVTLLSIGLGGTAAGVLLAHSVPAVGYGALYLLGALSAYDERVEDAARTLGAAPRQVLRHVTLPLLRRPLLEVFALAWLVSWAQVPLTLLVGAGAVRTLPVEVLSFVSAGQDRWASTGALLLVAPALVALAALRVAVRRTAAVAL